MFLCISIIRSFFKCRHMLMAPKFFSPGQPSFLKTRLTYLRFALDISTLIPRRHLKLKIAQMEQMFALSPPHSASSSAFLILVNGMAFHLVALGKNLKILLFLFSKYLLNIYYVVGIIYATGE